MSLNAINPGASPIYRPQEIARTKVEGDRNAATVATREADRSQKAAATGLLAPRHEALPAEAPEGTDPQLWQMLTAEERSHFAKMTSMGPLTYGRPVAGVASQPSGETSVRRGGRIDVRA